MSPFAGFVNLHPFFVHAPIVLVPSAAIMVWLGRRIRKEGFDTATFLVTIAAALTALVALASGLWASATVLHDGALAELVHKHQANGIALTAVTAVAALAAVAEWRGWVRRPIWWLRGALLTWAAIGVVFSAHNGATLVYLHGAAVVRSR